MTTTRPADSFTEGGLGEAIVLAQTVEQMVTGMGHAPTRSMPPQPPVSYTCGTAFCQACGCCLNCFPFCCEGGCY